MMDNNKVAVYQIKKVIQDIRGYKGEWNRAEAFENFVTELNKWASKLGLIEFIFKSFHYSSSGKTINQNGFQSLLNHLEILESMFSNISTNSQKSTTEPNSNENNKIFIVHGRDRTALLETENIIRKIGLEPIILNKIANNGLCLIEKFEKYSNVQYAIVLLTPDDIGALFEESPNYMYRARQNVIFEMGFFYGKLGRSNVCCIYKSSLELPSDVNGIAYLPYNQSVEEVEMALLRELKGAKFAFNVI
jgi:predicted nucleotide-binding protein